MKPYGDDEFAARRLPNDSLALPSEAFLAGVTRPALAVTRNVAGAGASRIMARYGGMPATEALPHKLGLL